jgi:hypothetical protein
MVDINIDDSRVAYAISGGWREKAWKSTKTGRNRQKLIRKRSEATARRIIADGDVINSGGGLGVDSFVLGQVLEFGDVKTQINVYLPVNRWKYFEHFFIKSDMGDDSVITQAQAHEISNQLQEVMRLAPHAIHDRTKYRAVHPESYAARNTTILENSHALYAIHVDDTEGVRDAIKKAREMGIPVYVDRHDVAKRGWASSFARNFYNIGREALRRNRVGKDLTRLLKRSKDHNLN